MAAPDLVMDLATQQQLAHLSPQERFAKRTMSNISHRIGDSVNPKNTYVYLGDDEMRMQPHDEEGKPMIDNSHFRSITEQELNLVVTYNTYVKFTKATGGYADYRIRRTDWTIRLNPGLTIRDVLHLINERAPESLYGEYIFGIYEAEYEVLNPYEIERCFFM